MIRALHILSLVGRPPTVWEDEEDRRWGRWRLASDETSRAACLGVPAAPAEQAERHFGRKLEYETDPSDVWQDVQRELTDFVLIDTRSRGAFHAGHIPGAISLPAGAIDASTISALPSGSVAITYCWDQAATDRPEVRTGSPRLVCGSRR